MHFFASPIQRSGTVAEISETKGVSHQQNLSRMNKLYVINVWSLGLWQLWPPVITRMEVPCLNGAVDVRMHCSSIHCLRFMEIGDKWWWDNPFQSRYIVIKYLLLESKCVTRSTLELQLQFLALESACCQQKENYPCTNQKLQRKNPLTNNQNWLFWQYFQHFTLIKRNN